MNVKWFQKYTLTQGQGANRILGVSGSSPYNQVSLTYAIDQTYVGFFRSGNLTSSGTLVGGSGVLVLTNNGIDVMWTGTFPSAGQVWSGTVVNFYDNQQVLVSHAETKRMYPMIAGSLTVI